MPPQIEIALLRLCADCNGALTIGQSYSIEAGGKVLRISVDAPVDAPPAPQTECEQETLDAVRVLFNLYGRRVTAKEVMAELENVGHIWGRSTILNALATLVHRGLLVNKHDKRGYGVPIPIDDQPCQSRSAT